ncbi:hypothetical protein PAXRUDRAFT_245757 [Paxillus rubicundulus Ve08.2h10]|uniref:Uncharacterized protein n=1 Tax=Paxillus rubicundulus Ve08.2h10 TaxID=930991 RepID=A0A0D0DG55_9AGAM|nr:hypothetical protein PAXRUDRAFT_245757 [Paxillus rubicundulus Ve08.2h10]
MIDHTFVSCSTASIQTRLHVASWAVARSWPRSILCQGCVAQTRASLPTDIPTARATAFSDEFSCYASCTSIDVDFGTKHRALCEFRGSRARQSSRVFVVVSQSWNRLQRPRLPTSRGLPPL